MNKHNLKSGHIFATIGVIVVAVFTTALVIAPTAVFGEGEIKPALGDLAQWDGSTSIIEGWIMSSPRAISFSANIITHISTPEGRLQVELRRFEESFTGIDDGGIFASDLVSPGWVARVIKFPLYNGKYHWRARAIDSMGNTSDWQEFGAAGNVDFEILTAGSPSQIAAEPLVDDVSQFNKKLAQEFLNLYEDPLNKAAGDIIEGGTLLLCVGDLELISKFIFCGANWVFEKVLVDKGLNALKQKLTAIVEDPPRDDYDVVAKVKLTVPFKPSGKTALDSATARRLTTLYRQADLLEALRITMERLQGAFTADEGRFMLVQGAALRDLTERLRDNYEHQAEVAKQLSRIIGKNWNDELDSWFSRIIGEGFSPEERQAFIEAGFASGEIDAFEADFAALVPAEDYLPSMLSYFENEAAAAESASQSLRDALSVINSSLVELLSVVCPGVDDAEECVEI